MFHTLTQIPTEYNKEEWGMLKAVVYFIEPVGSGPPPTCTATWPEACHFISLNLQFHICEAEMMKLTP